MRAIVANEQEFKALNSRMSDIDAHKQQFEPNVEKKALIHKNYCFLARMQTNKHVFDEIIAYLQQYQHAPIEMKIRSDVSKA